MLRLHPCPSCHRHVDAGDPVCPFCNSAVAPLAKPRPLRVAGSRLATTSALVAFGVAVSACYGGPAVVAPPATPSGHGVPPSDGGEGPAVR